MVSRTRLIRGRFGPPTGNLKTVAGERERGHAVAGHAGGVEGGSCLSWAQLHAPSRRSVGPRFDDGVPAREGEEAHSGRVLGPAAFVSPAAASELEQLLRIRDSDAVVRDGDLLLVGRDLHVGRAGPSGVLQYLADDRGRARVEESRHLVHCGRIDPSSHVPLPARVRHGWSPVSSLSALPLVLVVGRPRAQSAFSGPLGVALRWPATGRPDRLPLARGNVRPVGRPSPSALPCVFCPFCDPFASTGCCWAAPVGCVRARAAA